MSVVERSADLDPNIAEVVAITQDLFDCAPVFEVMRDPEAPEHRFVVVTVEHQGEPEESLEKRLEWHRRVRSVSPGHFGNLRLLIVPLSCKPTNS